MSGLKNLKLKMEIEIDETLPDYFHKFTSAERAIEIVENQQLWFSSPKKFNDPFDCNINLIDFEPNEDQIKMVINNKVQRNRQTRREEIKKNKRNAFRIRNQFAEQANEFYQNSGVCCFSEKRDNILLWAHYADNHRGICLKFSKGISEIATMTGRIQYKDKYEKASFFNDKGDAVYHLIFTKSKDWIYEKEVRSINILDYGNVDFKAEYLTEIIFGCKTEKSVVSRMKKVAMELNFKHIKFIQAKQTKSSFELKFV